MDIVKSAGVLSVAKIMGLIYGCLGLLFAPLFLLVGLLGSLAGQQKTPLAGIFSVVFAILMPVLRRHGIYHGRDWLIALQLVCQMGGRI